MVHKNSKTQVAIVTSLLRVAGFTYRIQYRYQNAEQQFKIYSASFHIEDALETKMQALDH